jgi:hypothetical protein
VLIQFLVDFRRPAMVLKSAFAAALCTGLLMLGGPGLADEYKAGELLGLDLSKAALSPKRLGPDAEFAPVPIEARTGRKQVKTERVVVPKVAVRKTSPARVHAELRGAARTKLTRRHTNPLDAQARLPSPCCQVCGCERPKRFLGIHKLNAPELDHRIPMAKRGPHTSVNAHRR